MVHVSALVDQDLDNFRRARSVPTTMASEYAAHDRRFATRVGRVERRPHVDERVDHLQYLFQKSRI